MLHAAISDLDGKTQFYTTNSPLSGGLFKHKSTTSHEWQEVSVDCFRLDSLLRDIQPDLIKIDVEGSELRVLRGCTRILKEGKARFLIEVHRWADPEGQKNPTEVFDFMKSFRYYSTNLYGRYYFVKKAHVEVLLLLSTMRIRRLLSWMARRMLPASIRRRLLAQWQRYGYQPDPIQSGSYE
ncbi:hypothetical protein ES703_34294 [subsurface metagenome]